MQQSHFLPDAEATLALGRAIAGLVEVRAVIALTGNLGAGKTTFVQGLAAGLGVAEVVSSPTFTMLNEYHSGRLPLFHFDLYRLSGGGPPAVSAEELVLEMQEFLALPGIVVFEWSENLQSGLPADRVTISLEYDGEEGRLATLSGYGEQSLRLLGDIARMVISR